MFMLSAQHYKVSLFLNKTEFGGFIVLKEKGEKNPEMLFINPHLVKL